MDKTKREVSRFEWDERTAPRLTRNEELICRDCRHRSEKSGICGKYPQGKPGRAVCSIASAGAENTAPNQNKTREVFHLLPGRVWKISRVLFPALTSQNPGTSGWAECRCCSCLLYTSDAADD